MREIKFRAWDKRDKIWCDWEHNIMLGLDGEVFRNGIEDKAPEVELMQFTGLQDKNGKDIYEGDIIEKLSWNVSQIGENKVGDKIETCKKGLVEIFEIRPHTSENWIKTHDLALYWSKDFEEVVYDNEVGFRPLQDNDLEFGRGIYNNKCRVVGNIYSNPELLK